MTLSDDQLRRYARNITLDGIGREGQQKLLAARVLVVGAGGLGAPVISYLAASGIGTIGIVDSDRVELSNLQRQIIHETGDIGRLKVESAHDRAEEINPDVTIIPHAIRIDESNAPALIADYDVVVDGSDNFATRFAVHTACYQLNKPLVSGAIRAFGGQVSTFKGYLGEPHPCYQCFIPEQPPEIKGCAETGVLGAVTGVIGSLQALEVIKEIVGLGESLSGKLLIYDALTTNFRTITLPKDPSCKLCTK